MKSAIERLKAAIDVPLYAMQTADRGECVVYEYHVMSDDGAKQRIRLKTRAFAGNMVRALELQAAIDRAIITRGDERLTASISSCRRSSGGWLEQNGRHCRIAGYDPVCRIKSE